MRNIQFSILHYCAPCVNFWGIYHASAVYDNAAIQKTVFLFSIFAGGGVDYGTPNPATFTFTSGQTTQCTNIPINDDTLCEGDVDETFTIQLSSPSDPGVSLSPAFAPVSIDDNDRKSLLSGTHKKCTHSMRF